MSETYPISEEEYKKFWDAIEADQDMVNSPPHYANKQIEVIDYIDDTIPDGYSYCFGNAIKYLSRHLNKGKPVQDLEKCKWYIDRMIEVNKC